MPDTTVLVIGADAVFARNLRDTLAAHGYPAPDPVTPGEDALAALESTRPDLVIMDIDPPGTVTGIDVAEIVSRCDTVPVIFLTGRAPHANLHGARAGTLHSLLIKPVTDKTLIDAIGRILVPREPDRVSTKKEELSRRIFESMDSGFAHHEIVLDGDGKPCDYRFLEVNPAFERLTGLKSERLIGRTVLEILPDTEPFWIETYGRVALTGETARFDHYSRELDKYFEVTAVSTVRGCFAAIFLDVTDRKRVEDTLRQSLVLLDDTQHLARVGGWVWDVERRTMTWTDETYRIHGLEPGDVPEGSPEHITQSLACYDPGDRPVIEAAFRRCAEEGTPYDMVLPITTVRGERIWIRTMARPVRERDRIVRVVGNIMDITDRRRAEEALREREEFFRAVMDNLPVGVAVNSVLPSVHFTYMNDNFPKMYRTTREALADPDAFWTSVYEDPVFREEIKNRVLDDIASGDPARMHWDDIPIAREGGGTAYINARNTPVPGRPLMISTVWDVTDRKRVELALVESERRYHDIFESVPVSIWEYDCSETLKLTEKIRGECSGDLDGYFDSHPGALAELAASLKLLDVNEETLRMYGARSKEDIFREFGRHRLPESVEAFRSFLSGFLGTKTLLRVETMNETLDGRRINIILSAGFTEESFRRGRIVFSVLDITERKRAEEALAHSHDLMRYIIEHNRSAIAVFDRNMNYIYYSQRYLDDYRIPEKNILGKCHYDLFPELPDAVRDIHRRVLNGEVLSADDEPFPRADGSVDWVRWECRPWFEITGAIGGLVLYTEVITERKRAEMALQESEERFRAAFMTSPDSININRMSDGVYLDINEGFTLATGYTRDECIGKTSMELSIWEDDRDRIRLVEGLREKGFVSNMEARFRLKDGTVRTGLMSARVVSINRETCILSVTRDITERKEAEQALRESERKFARLVAQSPISIEVYDSDGLLIEANEAYEKLWHIRKETVVGKYNILHHQHSQTHGITEQIRKAFNGEATALPLLRHNPNVSGDFPTSRERFVQPYIYPIADEGGGVSRVVLINVDVTEQQRLEDQLQQARKMESVGRLAGGVAHDFNNMLAVILMHAELALLKTNPSDPLYADLKDIQNAGQRSADLTRQLLAFARKQTVAPKVLDLNETIEGMLKMLRRLIGEDITLFWNPGSALWRIRIDPSQIDQILANLCVNSRDAISDVGKITIETANSVFDDAFCADHPGFAPGEYVMLAVSDNGCGMDKETVANIFEPFFTTKEIGKGTGLGLATVYGIVKQNDGFINVYSEPGEGTTIKIYIPRYAVESEPEVHAEQPDEPEGGSETILLVEDEPAILKLSRFILEDLGYTVISACTPGEAERIAGEYGGPIHLLMTDVVMPEMNGRDLAERIRALQPGIRRLFFSGYTANVIARHGVLEEGVHFIQKPFTIRDLAAKVREALS